jgi:hypothetical protein
MNFEAWDFVLALANAVGVALVGFYTWWANRDKATSDAIERVRTSLDDTSDQLQVELRAIGARVSEVEHDIGNRLKLQDLGDLYEALNKINREMGELSAELRANRNQLQMHQEFLMKTGAR